MKLIIGLGNPTIKYEKTRHNLGRRIVEQLVQKIGVEKWKMKMQFHAFISQTIYNQQKTILVKPQTFMNNSGQTVKLIVDYYKIPPEEILVIHDDIDLPLGKIKVQKDRGAAGHKGVQSIIDQLKTKDFIRMRVGIRPSQTLKEAKVPINTEKFVLEKFTDQEEKIIKKIIKKAAGLITAAL